MANLYVRSTDGNDSDNGSTWALAKATLAGALAAASAGDTIYVSDNHAESQASAMTLTSPGTAANPVRIICVDDSAEPPTARATTATVSTTGTNTIVFGAGFAYVYGVAFYATSTSAVGALSFSNTASAYMWVFEACVLGINTGNNATTARVTFGASGNKDSKVVLLNTGLKFNNASQAVTLMSANLAWRNTATPFPSTVPTTLFIPSTAGGLVDVSGLDLSGMGNGTALVKTDVAFPNSRFFFRNCKLGASVAAITGTIPGPGGAEVYIDNCDSADTNYRMERYTFQGSVVQETTKVRTGGASDGTTGIAWNLTTLATGPTLFTPLESPAIYKWNENTGSAKTVTVEILHDSATNLKDNEVWLEVEYLGTSGYPLSSVASDMVSDPIFGTPADQTGSSETWTTTGLTNPNKQKLAVTFTPQEKGLFRAVVKVAKANYTVYVDPVLTVS
jgi:hypothetical protein